MKITLNFCKHVENSFLFFNYPVFSLFSTTLDDEQYIKNTIVETRVSSGDAFARFWVVDKKSKKVRQIYIVQYDREHFVVVYVNDKYEKVCYSGQHNIVIYSTYMEAYLVWDQMMNKIKENETINSDHVENTVQPKSKAEELKNYYSKKDNDILNHTKYEHLVYGYQNNIVDLLKNEDKYSINRTDVDFDTYMLARDVVMQGGTHEAVYNSVIDIIDEYKNKENNIEKHDRLKYLEELLKTTSDEINKIKAELN